MTDPTPMSKEMEWRPTYSGMEPNVEEGVVVETKISDANGERNFAKLYRQGGLWFFEDGSMYVYYTPTHFRPAPPPKEAESK